MMLLWMITQITTGVCEAKVQHSALCAVSIYLVIIAVFYSTGLIVSIFIALTLHTAG